MNFWKLTTDKKIIPLAFWYYYTPVLLIALCGVADALYLSIGHYRIYTDISYQSFCAISFALNCDTVSMSPYAIFLNVPVADWGLIGYFAVLLLIIFAGNPKAEKKHLWPVLFWISLFYSCVGIVLAWISAERIHSYCIMCILSYLVNFALMYYAWFINRRFNNFGLISGLLPDLRFLVRYKKIFLPVLTIFLCITLGLVRWLPAYWVLVPPKLTAQVATGTTSDGFPWIGARDPKLTIVEFSDYVCPHCRKFHYNLRQLIEKYPQSIRLIHRNFPMDSRVNPLLKKPFHDGAADLAIIAIYALENQKFWQANDFLYGLNLSRVKQINTRKIAQGIGLNADKVRLSRRDIHLWQKLLKDIRDGLDYGVQGTPAFLINGKVYQGYIPPGIIEKALK